ncbi:MAG TPA: stage 0 sporulation family protein [Bacillota bacterium]|nr:stage 0 sporulation family protein [Bacillota bacterium]
MPQVVGVCFRRAGRVYHFDPAGFELALGDRVVVETVRGTELGRVATPIRSVPDAEVTLPLKRVLRKATPDDVETARVNRARERDAHGVARRKIESHGLDLSLVDVEYSFDGSRIIFYFTAEERVDFRELVKDLAATFRARIELRQIGVRDEAKLLGGLGPCGRELCCCSFLTEFQPVSIRMAKDQNLSLNPAKISGVCGRLMCCLRFECEQYDKCRASLPAVGATVVTPQGEGRVTSTNLTRGTVTVAIADRSEQTFPAHQVAVQDSP